jgi:hypoxanthine-guanine phosphoribosyltransferase
MDLLLRDRNKITNIVDVLRKNKPEGGANFFDRVDEFVRDPKNVDMVFNLINKIKQDYGQNFNLIVTGKFGDWVFNLIKTNKINVNGVVIHVSGSLRSAAKNKTFQIIGGNENQAYNKKFILLDDSFYSGTTKKEIDKHLNKYNSKIISTYVFYDGSFQKRPDVFSVYRHCNYNKEDILPVKKLLSILNGIDDANIPYDLLENQIMIGQIRSVKELLREIQIVRGKFGKQNLDIKSYGYKREYEHKKMKKYGDFVNESKKKYLTFDDLEFKKHPLAEVYDEMVAIGGFDPFGDERKPLQQAKMKFENGYGVSVLLGDLFYSNGVDTYEIMCFDDKNKFIGDPLGHLTKDEVNHEMMKLQRRKHPIQKFTTEDPYGEEDWSDDIYESIINKGDFEMTTIQLWHKYIRFGRKETIDRFRKNVLEFKTDSKGLKEYKGKIIGFYPLHNNKTREIIILFDTKEYGTLKVNDKYPIIVKSEVNEHLKKYEDFIND